MFVYSRKKFYEDAFIKKVLKENPNIILNWEPCLKDGTELTPHPNPVVAIFCMFDPVTGITIHKDWTEELQPCDGEVAKC